MFLSVDNHTSASAGHFGERLGKIHDEADLWVNSCASYINQKWASLRARDFWTELTWRRHHIPGHKRSAQHHHTKSHIALEKTPCANRRWRVD